MEKHFLRAHFFAACREIGKRLALAVDPLDQLRDVEAAFVVETAVDVRNADNFVARFVHQISGLRADVAKALNDDASAATLHSEFLNGFVAADHQATAGSFRAALRAAEFKRLAGDYGGSGLARVHGVSVHHPGHGLRVRANIGGGNIALGPKPFAELGGVAAGDALNLGLRELARVADYAALRATEGNIYDRAFPGHPGGEGSNFIEADVRGETDTALTWASDCGMQHAIAGEDFELAIVERNRNVNRDFLAGVLQVAVKAIFQIQLMRGDFEARFRRLINV